MSKYQHIVENLNDESLLEMTNACEIESGKRFRENREFMKAKFLYPLKEFLSISWQKDIRILKRLFILTVMK